MFNYHCAWSIYLGKCGILVSGGLCSTLVMVDICWDVSRKWSRSSYGQGQDRGRGIDFVAWTVHHELGVLPIGYFDGGAWSRCPCRAKVPLDQWEKTLLSLLVVGYVRTSICFSGRASPVICQRGHINCWVPMFIRGLAVILFQLCIVPWSR